VDSKSEQNTHWVETCQPLLSKLDLVKILSLLRSHTNILIFKISLVLHIETKFKFETPQIQAGYIECTEKIFN
jgi:hypothetical protein